MGLFRVSWAIRDFLLLPVLLPIPLRFLGASGNAQEGHFLGQGDAEVSCSLDTGPTGFGEKLLPERTLRTGKCRT